MVDEGMRTTVMTPKQFVDKVSPPAPIDFPARPVPARR